jgi:hypothetical protein
MRTLIYKRTHKGDPSSRGLFGEYDCMGRVRGYPFDAVIGVGGVGSEPREEGIAGKLTWIGVGARKIRGSYEDPSVKFEHFVLFDEKGKSLDRIAPNLARRMYRDYGPRFVYSDRLSDREQEEVERILKMAMGTHHSVASRSNHPHGCKSANVVIQGAPSTSPKSKPQILAAASVRVTGP